MEFDYVVVSGCSTGCMLAALLSEHADVRVCLLECGGEGKGLAVRVPAGMVFMVPSKPFKLNNGCFHIL